VLPIEDFLSGVEKAVCALLEEAAEEVRQETVRILKASKKPRDNLSGAERRALRTLRTNADLMVLPADKGNVVFNTSDYKQKSEALLGAPTNRRLPKDPTEAVERNTTLLLKQSSFSRSYNSCGHRVRGLPDCTGSQRSTRKVPRSGPSSAPSAPQRTAWSNIWLSSAENT
jgi:hypothetical protein